MKKYGIKMGVCGVLLALGLVMSGCSSDNGKQKLCQLLYSPYTAEINVVFGDGEQAVALEARVAKSSDSTRLELLSPEPYAGLCAESVCGKLESFSLAYDGVRAELPKSALERVSLALELMSDHVANAVEGLPASDFIVRADQDEAHMAFVSFTQDDCEYRVEYDPSNGTPSLLSAQTNTQNIEIRMIKFKPETTPS